MGTETINWRCSASLIAVINVKLNNPLMGTETVNKMDTQYIMNMYEVKLNNPLMGTETRFWQSVVFVHGFCWLN